MRILKTEPITFEQARKLAEEEAKEILKDVNINHLPPLEDFYLEAEECWMFYRNPSIFIEPKFLLGRDFSYGVSKRGNMRLVYDLRETPGAAEEYIIKLSDYMKSKGE
jgi:hypothetical protein